MAFLHSEPPVRQPVFQAPPIVLGLIAGLLAAHGARTLLDPERSAQLVDAYAFSPARYSHAFLAAHGADPGSLLDRALPFVTHMALHGDWTHVGINCLWLLAFGPVVARRLGPVLFLVFFIVCGVAGAAAFMACNWGTAVPMVGASGAISGLMGAAMRLLPTLQPWKSPSEIKLAPLFSRQLWLFTAVWAAINILVGYTGVGVGPGAGAIAWQAHLGGYAAGLILISLFDRLRPRPPVTL